MKGLYDLGASGKKAIEARKPLNQEAAILYFGAGMLSAAEITPFPMMPGAWQLELVIKGGERVGVSVARSERLRKFKTLDAAYGLAAQIGFKMVKVIGEI